MLATISCRRYWLPNHRRDGSRTCEGQGGWLHRRSKRDGHTWRFRGCHIGWPCVDLLGEPEDVDDRAPSLQMTVDVQAADNNSEIDVVGADVVDADVADVDVEDVADHDKHLAVTNEELHRRMIGPCRLRKKKWA